MADDGMAGAIYGPGDPFAPQEVQAGSLFGAAQQAGGQRGLGNEFAGFLADAQRAGAVNLIGQITPEKLAAQNDYAAALNHINADQNSPNFGQYDPLGYVTQNPDMNSYAKYRLLTASPSQVAVDRVNLAHGAVQGYEAQRAAVTMPAFRQAAGQLLQGGAVPGTAAPGLLNPSGPLAGAGGMTADQAASMPTAQLQQTFNRWKAQRRGPQPGGPQPGMGWTPPTGAVSYR